MIPAEFHELDIAQQRLAHLFDVTPRAVRRWRDGERRTPRGVALVIRLLAAGALSIEQLEQVAGPLSARRMNGEPERPIVESALEPSAPLDLTEALPEVTLPHHGATPAGELVASLAEAALDQPAALGHGHVDTVPNLPSADPLLTSTAEKLVALAPRSCHWPIGDPQHSDFHFCGEATAIPPYCAAHRAEAYMALPPRPAPRSQADNVRKRRGLYSALALLWAS
jgi:GcrA cell cycle regulator